VAAFFAFVAIVTSPFDSASISRRAARCEVSDRQDRSMMTTIPQIVSSVLPTA